MSDCMKWEPIEDCPERIDVLFLFEGDYGKNNEKVGQFTMMGRVGQRFYSGTPPRYYIGFEINGVTVDLKSGETPIAFARITLPDFLSDGDE